MTDSLVLQNAERFVDEHEAAQILSISENTLRRWRWRCTGPPYVRIGSRAIRYKIADLLAFAEGGRFVP